VGRGSGARPRIGATGFGSIDDERARDWRVLRLETGVVSHAALALYEKAGFRRITPFADYQPDPLSMFMEKHL